MNKTAVAMGAAFLTVVLGGCSGPDNVLHSCQEGARSAKVMADREDIDGKTRPVVSVSLFLRRGNIGSGASRTPIYMGEKLVHPTPAKILEQQKVADAYCANGTVPLLKRETEPRLN